MPRKDRVIIAQRQNLAPQTGRHRAGRAGWQVGSPNRAGEKYIPGKNRRLFPRDANQDRALGVSRGMIDDQVKPCQGDPTTVAEFMDRIWFAEGQAPKELTERATVGEGSFRVGKEFTVGAVNVGGDAFGAADRPDREGVV
ncbi:hypothetical protein GALL_414950 [mine drainage metagenome]|uniref:Uncharacterized protein n=1 Tax=mine drainage metagenome TaxID=410659 RepID=A0A1J5Q9Z5_9ZZZZ